MDAFVNGIYTLCFGLAASAFPLIYMMLFIWVITAIAKRIIRTARK